MTLLQSPHLATTDTRAACAQYVTECFSNHSLFHKALKEAFEAFCNKPVGHSTSAELMASFCDNLLKKVCLETVYCVSFVAEVAVSVVEIAVECPAGGCDYTLYVRVASARSAWGTPPRLGLRSPSATTSLSKL